MISRFIAPVLLFAVFVGCFSGAVSIQKKIVDAEWDEIEQYRKGLYLPSSDYVKLISIGYDFFVADYLWQRSIQAYGATLGAPHALPQMKAYFDVITDLDCKFMAVYPFANLVLGESSGDDEAALAIMEKGSDCNPTEYRIPFEAAYYSLFVMKDMDLARYWITRALAVENHPDWISSWLSHIETKEGNYRVAFRKQMQDFLQFSGKSDPGIAGLRLLQMRRTCDTWYLTTLREKAIEAVKPDGTYPSVAELEAAGAFLDVEWPDFAGFMALVTEAAENNRLLPSSEEDVDRYVDRFVHAGWKKMPPCPRSLEPRLAGYIIWSGNGPWPLIPQALPEGYAGPPESIEDRSGDESLIFALSERDLVEQLDREFRRIDDTIQACFIQYGRPCPETLDDVPGYSLGTTIREPWGGRFYIDPNTCRVELSTLNVRFLAHRTPYL